METFILILQAIVQGIVQGITEWLPISSTGHILLLNAVWKMQVSEAFMNVFKVVIQLGSVLAVVVLYFHRLNPFSKRKTPEQKKRTFSLWGKVLVGSIPVAVIGLLLDDFIDLYLSIPAVIAAALILYGIAFIWVENRRRTPTITHMRDLDYKTALKIGCFETLSLIPGTSRSGSTILGAMLLGTTRPLAAEFSFFMAIPAMVGASGLKLVKSFAGGVSFMGREWVALIVATAVSFVVSLFAIRFLMGFIKKHNFKPFGIYRIILGIVVLICVFAAPKLFT